MNYDHIVKGWRMIAPDKYYYFRSKMEMNYARILQHLKQNGLILDWEYEPEIFKLPVTRGLKQYQPDFKVFDFENKFEYHETKGHFSSKDKTRMKNFKKYYPEYIVIMIMTSEFKKLAKKYKDLILDWE